ncbi:thioredoxin domain-containing protein [Patescibacteria group bacterium]|nr:thioredoxin domain-containing protein [Patescibacteria group bacterium]
METHNTGNNYFLPIAVVIGCLFIAGAVYWNGAHPSAAPAGGTQPGGTAPIAVDIKNVKMDGDPYIGSPTAPVTIAFWSDFQCPFCKEFEVGGVKELESRGTTSSLPDIIKNYVNTGKVKIVFMDMAFLGNDSITAAEYGRSVWKLYPQQYFAWRTAMYTAQGTENTGWATADKIEKITATVSGLDVSAISADVKANASAYQAMMDADKAEAGKVGISATPSFVIGKQVIAGAYPYSTFQSAIDALLK